MWYRLTRVVLYFFFNDTATTEIYTLSLHDALPICAVGRDLIFATRSRVPTPCCPHACQHNDTIYDTAGCVEDRKSTRLNSSHSSISYAVFCLKKKKKM